MLKSFLVDVKDPLSSLISNIVVDVLAMQRARASAVMAFTLFWKNIWLLAQKGQQVSRCFESCFIIVSIATDPARDEIIGVAATVATTKLS